MPIAKKPRSTKRRPHAIVYARLPVELVEALDAWAERLNKRPVERHWNRNDLVRVVLARAVQERGKDGEP